MKKALIGIFSTCLLLQFSCKKTPETFSEASLWVTTPDEKSLLEKSDLLLLESNPATNVEITIDTATTYQSMDGFGYTLTGGSALHLSKMQPANRQLLLQELFGTGPNDIGVSYLRVSIGASDLDEQLWSYDDLEDGETDLNLEKFSMAYDTLYLIPVLQEILKIAPEIKILGSPWSPPKWMKDNNDTRGGSLKPEYYASYANYFVKYIEGMAQNGIQIDAITVQNEPLHPGNNPSLLMLPEDQNVFVRDFLGPIFKANNIKTKIILYDHNADRPDYPITILNDSVTASFVDGSAFHLYGGEIEALSEVHNAHPDKNLYFTEQWIGAPANFPQELEWHTEQLLIGASRNWCKTVLEWNLAADPNQDPHTDRGGCDRCLGAVTLEGDTVTRNPGYYIIAHASKFVRPGALRMASNDTEELKNVAFLNTDGSLAVILQNKKTTPLNASLKVSGKEIAVQLPAAAVGTVLLKP